MNFNSKTIFLTYPQCPLLSKEVCSTTLRNLLEQYQPRFVRVAHEHHVDDGDHLHCLVMLGTRCHTRNAGYFDILGYHPNIQAPRKVNDVYEYCGKDGDIIDWGEYTAPGTSKWDDLVASETSEDFWTNAKSISRDYVINHERLEYYANKHYAKVVQPYVPDPTFEFSPDPIMTNWVENELNKVS